MINFINQQFLHNAEYKWLYDYFAIEEKACPVILQIPLIGFCWRTDISHHSGDSIIILETSSGAQFLNPGDSLGFGIDVGFPNAIFERVVVAGVTDSIVTIESQIGIVIGDDRGRTIFIILLYFTQLFFSSPG